MVGGLDGIPLARVGVHRVRSKAQLWPMSAADGLGLRMALVNRSVQGAPAHTQALGRLRRGEPLWHAIHATQA